MTLAEGILRGHGGSAARAWLSVWAAATTGSVIACWRVAGQPAEPPGRVETMVANSSGAAARWWAVVALLALLLLAAGLVAVAIGSNGALLAVALDVALSLVVVAATAWWAFTTRRVWKRRLNIALAALVIAALVVVVLGFGVLNALGVVALAVVTLAYPAAARRALAAAARSAPAVPTGSPPPSSPARPWLLVNPNSGGGKAERSGLVEAARSRGVEVHVLAPGDEPVELARQAVAAGADAVGVAGGDGSLGLVAAVAVEADVPFVCIPVGTRNHFAMDLGLDRADPLAALDAYAGPERRIDVGLVGTRVFLNNVSLGAYAEVVAKPSYRAEKLATAHDVLRGAFRGERTMLQVEFSDPEGRHYHEVLVLLVANNRYDLTGGGELVARTSMDDGVLQISALQARTGAALAGLATRLATRRASQGSDWAQWTGTVLLVEAAQAELPAGIDGESVVLRPPLEFRVLPGALRVLVPRELKPRTSEARVGDWATIRRVGAIALGGGTG
jgi:diacylglycerol kinase family enzyme